MRILTLLSFAILVVQINSCASQTDSTNSDLPTIEQRKKEKGISIKPSNAAEDPKVSPKDNKNHIGIADDDGEMGLSIISYDNIVEDITEEQKEEETAEEVEEDATQGAGKAELPVQGQKVKLMIQNNHNAAMWYLMPASGETEMPEDGKFKANPEASPPFLAKKFQNGSDQLVELIYHGEDGQSFRAFYVEAGASLLFRNYELGNYREGDYVPFWSAKELDVNNSGLLENWLPFKVMSSPNIVLHNTTESGPAKWSNLGDKVKFPKERVKFIQAGGIKRYQIPVGVVR